MKVCSQCKQLGHNKRTCKSSPAPENISEQGERKTLKDIGREILEKQNQKAEREPDEVGTLPAKGLWIVNPERKRIAGKISQVKKTGEILWIDVYGTPIESTPQTIKEGGYLFVDLEPKHLTFEMVGRDIFV